MEQIVQMLQIGLELVTKADGDPRMKLEKFLIEVVSIHSSQ